MPPGRSTLPRGPSHPYCVLLQTAASSRVVLLHRCMASSVELRVFLPGFGDGLNQGVGAKCETSIPVRFVIPQVDTASVDRH